MITGATARDIRFPTSQGLHGSDAMTPDPDYSAAYVTLTADDGLEGHGFTFTEGRGNELCVAAIEALAPRVQGLDLDEVRADPGEIFRRVTGDPQLRWLGPEKGVIHLATAAVVNAVWDMWARAEGKPLWRLVADFTPEQFVKAVPFQYLTDAIDPGSARELLEERAAGKDERRAEMERDGFPAYTTSAGWLGYTEEEIRRLAREAVAEGWNDVKMKVGGPPDEDARRAADHPRGDRHGAPPDDGRQPGLGRPRGDREDARPARSSSRTGWRSRPAPTTRSATPRSPRRSRRSRSPPASTA